ncbi:MAG: NAD(P)H-quinone oxidoreductase [Bacteroidota bacterium]
MKAILHDAPEGLRIAEVADPRPGPAEVLINIAATALNRADLLQVAGKYPVPVGANPLLGLEMAGTVMEVGNKVTEFEVGDNVCALLDGGGYAQLVTVPQDRLLRLPTNLSFTKAAAIPEAWLTAYQALHWIAQLKAGETVLIHAGASGVGSAAIQLVRLAGAVPIVTASGPKHEGCTQLGAAYCIDYRAENFAEAILAHTEGRGVDVLLDFIGGSYLEDNLKSLAVDGRMVMLGFLGGVHAKAMSLAPILRKRLKISGTTLRARSADYKARLTADFARDAWPAFADRRLLPVIDSIYDWNEVQSAHDYMRANANFGKIVMTVSED